jgi:hypothetical protein
MDKEALVKDIQRIAQLLDAKSLSRGSYEKHGAFSAKTAEKNFGSWNEAVEAAGLIPLPSGGLSLKDQRALQKDTRVDKISDTELLTAMLALGEKLGRRPSGNQLTAKGKYSAAYYIRRWGSVAAAYDEALSTQRA